MVSVGSPSGLIGASCERPGLVARARPAIASIIITLSFVLLAAIPAAAATTGNQMTSPIPGSQLTGSTVTFSWATTDSVSASWFYVGNSSGASDVFNSNQLAASTTAATVSGLPTDGRTLYVRLWSLLSSGWTFNDYTYTASMPVAAASVITSPTPGSQLTGSTVTFSWSSGTSVSSHLLYVGNMSQGVANLYASPTLSGSTTSQTVSGLPTNGGTLYVTLYSMLPSGWAINYYTYTAAVTMFGCPLRGPA